MRIGLKSPPPPICAKRFRLFKDPPPENLSFSDWLAHTRPTQLRSTNNNNNNNKNKGSAVYSHLPK